MALDVDKAPNSHDDVVTSIFVHPSNALISGDGPHYVRIKDDFIVTCESHPDVRPGTVWCAMQLRISLSLALGDRVYLKPLRPCSPKLLKRVDFIATRIGAKMKGGAPIQKRAVRETIIALCTDCYLNAGQRLRLRVGTGALMLTVHACTAGDKGDVSYGLFDASTEVTLNGDGDIDSKTGNNTVFSGEASATVAAALSRHWDFERMGIGGLDREFETIFRRAFASRIYPPAVVKRLGIRHVRGVLLHGPPGTGKTLMARQIGKILNAREPKIVSGPEVLNKYVGESEARVRALFADAEAEQQSRGDESHLHMIILDEFDAICRKRGGGATAGSALGDSVVNQLLAKIDGVNPLNNVLLIAMTNRLELIDSALLRPGRFEVHIAVGLPDERGRAQILSIHTRQMRESNCLDPAVSLDDIVARTKNYTGAELEGVVQAASSWALRRCINIDRLASAATDKSGSDIVVTSNDFERALEEIKPMFGAASDQLRVAAPNGIVRYSDQFEALVAKCHAYIRQARESKCTPLMCVLLEGPRGCGKTALSATLASTSEYPFVRFVAPAVAARNRLPDIVDAFECAEKSPLSFIVLDDVERLVDYIPSMPARFSSDTVQALGALLNQAPPPGHRLFVLATTSNAQCLRELGLFDSFDTALSIPLIKRRTERQCVLCALDLHEGNEEGDDYDDGVPIKQVITAAEMVRYEGQ